MNGEGKGFEIGGNSSELDFMDDLPSLTGLSDAKLKKNFIYKKLKTIFLTTYYSSSMN
jgi:hypothetical protein